MSMEESATITGGGAAVPAAGKKREFVTARRGPETVYDEQGNWTVFQHQDALRKIENPVFNKYYGELQKLVPANEWSALLETLRSPLPTTIWINDTDPLASSVSEYFKALDPSIVQPIEWYPIPGMAWRIMADKARFRKLPEMQPLRQYLIRQTALGTISRQEEVSMIPPFLLDIQPTDRCLDMCASPGSKTAQMLVALGRHKVVSSGSDASPFPFDYLSPGLVMANELDTKRANMLVHQCKRLRLLFPFALFANHDARYFPDVELPDESADGSSKNLLRFDKILCDVVCSGDGTIRKAPFIFKIWSPREALGLQLIQIQIALRACHLLKIGGRLVYSTCSLNPIENEAVVYQIMTRTKGAMKLVDCRSLIPSLRCDPGMNTWVVTNGRGEVVPEPNQQFHPSLFPPTGSDAGAVDFSLCMRFLPHHCNGGGFFIAVFDKVNAFEIVAATPATPTSATSNGEESVSEKPPKRPRNESGNNKGRNSNKKNPSGAPKDQAEGEAATVAAEGVEASVTAEKPRMIPPQYLPATDDMIQSLSQFYEVPNFPCKNLIARAGNGGRVLTVGINTTASLVSNTALEILRHKQDNLVIVSAGLRVLAHENLDNGWRIASEAACLFSKLMCHSKRVLTIDVPVMERLMEGGKLKELMISEVEDSLLQQKLEELPVGTVLLRIEAPKAVDGCVYSVALRARSRLQLLVDHEDLPGLRLRLGLEAGNLLENGDE